MAAPQPDPFRTEGSLEVGTARTGPEHEPEDEFDYAFEGRARQATTHTRVFQPRAVPAHLVSDVFSKTLMPVGELTEGEEEEETSPHEEHADPGSQSAVARSQPPPPWPRPTPAVEPGVTAFGMQMHDFAAAVAAAAQSIATGQGPTHSPAPAPLQQAQAQPQSQSQPPSFGSTASAPSFNILRIQRIPTAEGEAGDINQPGTSSTSSQPGGLGAAGSIVPSIRFPTLMQTPGNLARSAAASQPAGILSSISNNQDLPPPAQLHESALGELVVDHVSTSTFNHLPGLASGLTEPSHRSTSSFTPSDYAHDVTAGLLPDRARSYAALLIATSLPVTEHSSMRDNTEPLSLPHTTVERTDCSGLAEVEGQGPSYHVTEGSQVTQEDSSNSRGVGQAGLSQHSTRWSPPRKASSHGLAQALSAPQPQAAAVPDPSVPGPVPPPPAGDRPRSSFYPAVSTQQQRRGSNIFEGVLQPQEGDALHSMSAWLPPTSAAGRRDSSTPYLGSAITFSMPQRTAESPHSGQSPSAVLDSALEEVASTAVAVSGLAQQGRRLSERRGSERRASERQESARRASAHLPPDQRGLVTNAGGVPLVPSLNLRPTLLRDNLGRLPGPGDAGGYGPVTGDWLAAASAAAGTVHKPSSEGTPSPPVTDTVECTSGPASAAPNASTAANNTPVTTQAVATQAVTLQPTQAQAQPLSVAVAVPAQPVAAVQASLQEADAAPNLAVSGATPTYPAAGQQAPFSEEVTNAPVMSDGASEQDWEAANRRVQAASASATATAAAAGGAAPRAWQRKPYPQLLQQVEQLTFTAQQVEAAEQLLPDPAAGAGFFARLCGRAPKGLPPALKKQVVHVLCCARLPYSDSDPLHWDLLTSSYTAFKEAEVEPSRYGKHWAALGWQGDDPATDLRGCGILGLLQLVSLYDSNPTLARTHYQLSRDRVQEYPLAVVSLNMTKHTLQALREGRLDTYVKERGSVWPVLACFHIGAMALFNKLWREGNKTMSDSGFVMKEVELQCQRNIKHILTMGLKSTFFSDYKA